MRTTLTLWCWSHRDVAPPDTDECWTKYRRGVIGFADDRDCAITLVKIEEVEE